MPENPRAAALAYDAAHAAENGVRSLARQAKDAGATREEVGEARCRSDPAW